MYIYDINEYISGIYHYFFLQRCSPPTLLLSLSPGLGPDGLPSPGGYFPHSTNGSGPGGNITGSNSMNNAAVAVNNAAAAAISFAGAGIQNVNGSCNNPSPLGTVMGTQNSHRSSPCNELLAAMRSTAATNGEDISVLTLLLSLSIFYSTSFNLLLKARGHIIYT